MVKFCDNVTKQSGGALTIKFMGGPEVTPGANQAQAVLNGVADMSMHDMAELVPDSQFVGPFAPFDSRGKGQRFFQSHASTVQESWIHHLGQLSLQDGFYLMTKFKVDKPEDFADKKMRSSPPVAEFLQSFKNCWCKCTDDRTVLST